MPLHRRGHRTLVEAVHEMAGGERDFGQLMSTCACAEACAPPLEVDLRLAGAGDAPSSCTVRSPIVGEASAWCGRACACASRKVTSAWSLWVRESGARGSPPRSGRQP